MLESTSLRLAETLNHWKDACWYTQTLLNLAFGKKSEQELWYPEQARHWRTFEQKVFDNSTQYLKTADWMILKRTPESDLLFPYQTFPFEFFEWSRKSRRVFEIPADLQHAFATAAFPNITWADVLMPFDSFAVKLATPLVVEDRPGKWTQYDTILVSKITFHDLQGKPSQLIVRVLGPTFDGEKEPRLQEKDFRRVSLLAKRGQENEAMEKLKKMWAERSGSLKSTPGWRNLVLHSYKTPNRHLEIETEHFIKRLDSDTRQKIKGGIEEATWRAEPSSWAAKIAVGVMLYLQSLSNTPLPWREQRQPHRSQKGSRGVTGIITSPEYICAIVGRGIIDPSTYGLNDPNKHEGSQFFVRPHWRRAHMRRSPGSAPNAPKDVKVPPVLVREDLVPLFGIISGTKTKILPEE